jgi:FlaA1/EpsC-like NDP-sugar epimerase
MSAIVETVLQPWRDQVVMVTGAAGTVGSETLRQLLAREPRAVIGIDNNESGLFTLAQSFRNEPNVSFTLCDILDVNNLTAIMDGVDIVIHTAAFKHVTLCEYAPRPAIQTNIIGTQNVIQAALAAGVKRVLFTSSDKAVNPTNVMGTSKLMAERLMTAANMLSRGGRTIFASCRFGNVLGSRGSVIPLFRQQIAAGGPLTLTHPNMTRFIMTLTEAVQLAMRAVFLARGGEVFVTKMPVCRIEDLAKIMIEDLAPLDGTDPRTIPIELIGPQAGEKFYEELMSEEEVRRAIELEDYFVIVPALHSNGHFDFSDLNSSGPRPNRPYNSSLETRMTKEELRAYLRRNNFLGHVGALA